MLLEKESRFRSLMFCFLSVSLLVIVYSLVCLLKIILYIHKCGLFYDYCPLLNMSLQGSSQPLQATGCSCWSAATCLRRCSSPWPLWRTSLPSGCSSCRHFRSSPAPLVSDWFCPGSIEVVEEGICQTCQSNRWPPSLYKVASSQVYK